MGGFSIWHWLVVGIVILLLFGKGRFSEMMGDIAKGLKSFKKGMTEEEDAARRAEPRRLEDPKRVEVNERPTTIEAPTERPTTLETPAERNRTLDADERREP